eukprot:339538_1
MSSSSTKPVANSSKSQLTFYYFIPKPSQHPTNNKCIIISTHSREDKTTAGIYKYNIETNESQIIYKYNDIDSYCTFETDGHGQFINTSNNTLILYGGHN